MLFNIESRKKYNIRVLLEFLFEDRVLLDFIKG